MKLPVVEEDSSEFENGYDRSRLESRLEEEMFEIEKNDQGNELAKVAHSIKQSTEL